MGLTVNCGITNNKQYHIHIHTLTLETVPCTVNIADAVSLPWILSTIHVYTPVSFNSTLNILKSPLMASIMYLSMVSFINVSLNCHITEYSGSDTASHLNTTSCSSNCTVSFGASVITGAAVI